MKLLPLFLCLLLCGCTQKARDIPTEVSTIPTTVTVPETEPVSMYEPGHPLEEANRGALRVNPLTIRKVRGLQAIGDDLIVFSGYGSTTLTRLTGRDLTVASEITLDHELDPSDPSVRTDAETLSFYDPAKRQLVVLDKTLTPICRYDMTETITGSPILSGDQSTVYYCTYGAIRAWDVGSGIHRTIKELSYDDQQLTGLHLNDTVLQCRIRDGAAVRTLFLDAENGRLLEQQDGDIKLCTNGGHYYATLPTGGLELLIFGISDTTPHILYPADTAAESFFLPKEGACITASYEETGIRLSYYQLETGTLRAQLMLPPLQIPKSVLSVSGGTIYLLAYDPAADCDTIYRWDVPENSSSKKGFTEAYTGNADQDQQTLARYQAYAAELGNKYGIHICIGEASLAVQPWDYQFEAETLDRVLIQELELLDQRLSQYPQQVLEKTRSHFSSLTIALVRRITGTPESGSLDTATGVQFLDGTNAYVVISVGKYAEQALYHELFHVMETHILAESSAFDQWEALNPTGFVYHYGAGLASGMERYLSGPDRAFVDAYSTSFPKEDRARIMENAILPGNAQLFRSSTMQAKLLTLCEGIRQAYGLRKSPETYIWEQYLNFPMAYTE